MLGLSFLFGAALFALPLAALPIILHMLYRRKSPVVMFSTLRFIKSSLQQTAARRKIQRWILLACRVLLLALLIWAVAQPQSTPSLSPADRGEPTLAAIVLDTGYSMMLKEGQLTLLDRANEVVKDLLRPGEIGDPKRGPLCDTRVMIFRSLPSEEERQPPPRASAIRASWPATLLPQSSTQTLSQRCQDAVEFLASQPDQRKWLIVISDLQSRKFSTPLPQVEGIRTVLFDLHPEKGASHGIASVWVDPEQPLPGSSPSIGFDVVGRSGGEPRFASFRIANIEDVDLLPPISNLKASFSAEGTARVQTPPDRALPSQRWLWLKAKLDGEDDMAWDNERSLLLEIPLKQPVTFIDSAPPTEASLPVWAVLSLNQDDPKRPWLLDAKRGNDLTGRENAVVVILTEWPDGATVEKLLAFAEGGGNVVLLLQPGLELKWAKLSGAAQQELLRLLPGEPVPTLAGGGAAGTGQFVPVPPADGVDAVVRDMLTDGILREPPVVHRFVPFAQSTDPGVSTLLYLAPKFGDSRSAQFGLWFRRGMKNGSVFTIASLPDSRYMSPRVPWTFPLQLVKSCMRPPNRGDAQNVELGASISLSLQSHHIANPAGIRLVITPKDGVNKSVAYEFSPDSESGRFTLDDNSKTLRFAGTTDVGLYKWYLPGAEEPIAIANVQYPAADSELVHRPADRLLTAGPRSVIVRREGNEPYLDRLNEEMKKVSEPVHIWTWFIAIVLVLVCIEALLSSLSNLWRPLALKWRGAKGDAAAGGDSGGGQESSAVP